MLLIKSEVNLILSWSKNWALIDTTTRVSQRDNPAINAPTNASFSITVTKLYVPVVTLSTEDVNNLLQQLKAWFIRNVKWKKHWSEISNQTKIDNLNYFIDRFFDKVNKLFLLSFENEDDRVSYSKYYTPTIKKKFIKEL